MSELEVKPYQECVNWRNKLARLAWEVFRVLFFRPFSGPLWRYYRNWALRLWGAEIGRSCAISAKSRIYQPWKLHLGDLVAIGDDAVLYNCDDIYADSKAVISQYAYLCTASHAISAADNHLISAPIKLGRFSWVAADAFIGMGVEIGEGAVIGARSAVFKNVEPWTVVGGNPARMIKKRVITDPPAADESAAR